MKIGFIPFLKSSSQMAYLLHISNTYSTQFCETLHSSSCKPTFVKILMYCRLPQT